MASPAVAKIADPLVRRVVAEMDAEHTNRNLMARAKRNGTTKIMPAIRARMEPLAVSFVMENPLGVAIKIQEIQLVARLQDGKSVCTNEDAIEIRTGPPPPVKEWTFQSSTNTFFAPMFARRSPEGGTEAKGSWTADPLKPAFVVTQRNLTLKPGSKERISLSICPLERGELEILGVRCKLFDNIWVFHPFKLQGPLLQNNRENKANRARAKPVLLKSRIEQDMPRLTVSLVSTRYSPTEDESTASTLHGQVSKWNLRVCNIGTATASNLVLKTNVPWINIPTGRRRMSEDDATSTCIGPSGTLLKLGRAYERLEAGETMEIPVQIKTTSSIMGQEKKEDLYMLYRYEFDEPSTGATKQRWLREMVEVRVSPAVSLTATLMPSFWAKSEHIVSVEATNHIRGKLVLDKLSIASRDYRLEKIADQGTTLRGSTVAMVDYNERVSMHYRLIATPPPDADEDRPYNKCIISECPFQEGLSDRAKDSIRSEVTDFLCLESAATRFEKALQAHKYELARAAASNDEEPRHVSQIRRANTSMSGSGEDGRRSRSVIHPTSVARLCPVDTSKSKVDLICTWNAPNELNPEDVDVTGQNHVTGLSIRPLDGKTRKGCPITITCQHAATKTHNFAMSGPAHVPLEITVRNRLVEASVEFEFSVERPKTFEFIGAECFTWEMEGGEELTIPLTAVIPTPGMYNLQHVRLVVTRDNGQKVSYLFPLQWLVQVDNGEGR
uniref:TPPC8 C-terminal Ig-like domain-containing protein n=1 Tax=Grammatophora oceanica TaxID=210454 RepID=A0A7S1YLX7_9STRA